MHLRALSVSGSSAVLVGVGVVMAWIGCTSPSEPDRRVTLAEHLSGPWDLTELDGTAIPGWVRTCAVVFCSDSNFVATGRLAFESGAVCSRVISNAEQPGDPQTCRYHLLGNDVSVVFDGNPRTFSVHVSREPATGAWSDDLTLWGPPCDPWALVCHQYRERYRKSQS